jgi:cysteine-rich repeat protein
MLAVRRDVRALVFAAVSLLGAPPAGAWPVRIDVDALRDEARGVVQDAAGDVYAVGRTTAWASFVTVVKFAGPTGAELWRRELIGTSPSYYDVGTALRLDSSGQVLVTGLATNSLTIFDLLVTKLDATSGATVWRNDINGLGPGGFANDSGAAIIADPSGDVVAAGALHGTSFLDTDVGVVKLSGTDGTELWRAKFAGGSAQNDYAVTVSTDAAGDVFAGGWFANPYPPEPWQYDALLLKLDGATGDELWRWTTTPAGSDYFAIVNEVVVDPAGNPVIVGYTDNPGTSNDLFVAKLDGATGAELWRVDGAVPGLFYDAGFAVALDGAGDVVAGGSAYTGAAYEPIVLKLAGSDGHELWRQTLGGAPGTVCPCTESASGVAVDGTGDVLVTSGVDGGFQLAKLAGPSGAVLWVRSVFARPGEIAHPFEIALDAAGNAATAGYTGPLGDIDGQDFAVVKVSGADGHILGCGNGAGDPGEACDDGNLADGDGCASDCSRSCGNARIDAAAGEECDDANDVTGDGCEPGCRLTMCAGGVGIDKAKVVLDGALGVVNLRGDLAFAAGAPASYAPTGSGVQLLVEDAGSGNAITWGLTRATHAVPPADAGTCEWGDGWTTKATLARYRNASGAVDPPVCTAGSANGLTRVLLVDRRTKARGIHVRAKASGAPFTTPTGPVRLTVVLGGEAESLAGACAVVTFTPEQCVRRGARIVCK